MENKIKHLIALTHLKGIGFRRSRKILTKYGSAQKFISLWRSNSNEITPAIKNIFTAAELKKSLDFANIQLEYAKQKNVKIIPHFSDEYPYRLKRHDDSPLVLYTKGNMNLNCQRTIGVVGTRKMTYYGKISLERIIPGFARVNATIISGLAYGVDTYAHKESIAHNIPTIGVMGTGINQIYPATNRNLAEKMQNSGGVITEFGVKTKPDSFNFPLRNRIIAALSDALIVIESKLKGGAMITADLAFNYNKDVFAIPGKINDTYSAGTNALIKTNKAQLIESSEDVINAMNWDTPLQKTIQPKLFNQLDTNEKRILESFNKNEPFHLESILEKLQLSNSETAAILLNLQLKGIIKSLPGNQYLII
ncbi:DNA-processing protein DprA [Membranihabitans maritimus]|uniref:DNA-processing protein DprA n=1 Tax=Membranihabitans maritimus TaxID=2904244 RepID=UPI001F001F98|nr:DNA-processing protein DprA [Membranihabitans maritimus]